MRPSRDPKTPKLRLVAEYNAQTELLELREEEGQPSATVRALRLRRDPPIEVFEKLVMDRDSAIWLREAIDVLLSDKSKPGPKKKEEAPKIKMESLNA